MEQFKQGRSQTFQNEGAARGAEGWAGGADRDSKWRLSIDLCTKCNFIGGAKGGQSFCQRGRSPPCPPPPLATPLSLNGKLTAKIDFPIRHFMLPLLMLTLEVESLSIQYLVSICTTYWWNLNKNRMIRSIQNFVLFDKVLTPFWKTSLWLKQLFDAKLSMQRLSFFSVPKITIIRHV